MNMFLLARLSNMIFESTSCWVGGRIFSESVVRRFNKIQEKHVGVVILPVHFGQGLFCYSTFNFFYIDDTELL